MVLQNSGPISLNDIHQEAAGFTGAVAVEVRPSSGNFNLRSNNDWTSVKVFAIGGGGSGGAASTDAGREKVATGGGAGGTAVRTYLRSSGISSYSVTIGGGGGSVTASGGGGRRSGRSGGTTTFNPNVGTTISASGGERGYGSATDPAYGDNSDVYVNGWGYAHESLGGVGSGGQDNFTGGGATLLTRGGDGSGAKGGGSVNLVGQAVSGLNGPEIGGRGGPHFSARAAQPVYPQEFTLKNGSAAFSYNFQGGKGVQHSSGQAGTAENGLAYGGGGGGVAAEGGTNYSGSGASGAVILVYIDEGVSGTTVTINDEDVRGLIDKASGAQSSFSEFYGAAASSPSISNYPVLNIASSQLSRNWFGSTSATNLGRILNTNHSDAALVYSGMAVNGYRFVYGHTADDASVSLGTDYSAQLQSDILPRFGEGGYANWRPSIEFSITDRVGLSAARPAGAPSTGVNVSFDISLSIYNETSAGGYNGLAATTAGKVTKTSFTSDYDLYITMKWGSNKEGVLKASMAGCRYKTRVDSQVFYPELHQYIWSPTVSAINGESFDLVTYEGDRFLSSDVNSYITFDFDFKNAGSFS